ncbi:hypothetical protein PybrP1_012379 [[Pythium] brassicae (nom. inval.)]|nr:hypothetical protein PybrP1_012379 [[Pythium] brassicae (nom. inval.)]
MPHRHEQHAQQYPPQPHVQHVQHAQHHHHYHQHQHQLHQQHHHHQPYASAHGQLRKMASNGSMSQRGLQQSGRLQHLSGMLEVKFKGGAFATWSDVFVRLEGRWLTVHKREREPHRLGAIELGPGVDVTDLEDADASTKFPRRFDVFCKGGALGATEVGFRTKSRKDRDLWVVAIATNIHVLSTAGLDTAFGIADLEPVVVRLREALTLRPVRIRSDLAVRCASGADVVAFLVAEELASDRTHATIIGRRLLAMNVLHHVSWEKGFVDGDEQYTLAELDDELGYEIEHFQKFLDCRKFWKYFDGDGTASNASSSRSGGGRAGRSGTSVRGSAANTSHASVLSASHDGGKSATSSSSSVLAAASKLPPTLDVDKKAKQCSVCKKGFNPLRRRYVCRSCALTVCSHCSMARKVDSADEGAVSARVCVSCKLSAGKAHDDFYDQIFTGPTTTSMSEMSSASVGSGRASSYSRASTSSAQTASSAHTAAAACAYQPAPELDNEAERLASVRVLLHALEADPALKQSLLHFCSMATIACGCPTALVGLLDSAEYAVVAQTGAAPRRVARDTSFAAHTCRNGFPLVCSDLDADPRFAGNPWRAEVPHATFYAGIPLPLANGHIVGAIEVFDVAPRRAGPEVVMQLQAVVRRLVHKFEDIVAAALAEAGDDADEYELDDALSVSSIDSSMSVESRHEASLGPAHAPLATVAAAQDEPGASGALPTDGEMELRLLELLSRTTTTQEQIRNQQDHMVHAISSHSKQISELAKQLERMESTLEAKLGGGDLSP